MNDRRVIARHAGTVLIGQLAVMAFGVVDTIVAGRYAEGALAALSVGSAIFVTVYVALMGGLQALLPIWAESHGAGRAADIGRSLRQSLYLCAAATLLGMAVLLGPGPLLRWTQIPPDMQAEVSRYLALLAFALAPALLFRLYGTLNQSLGHPRLVTALQIGALALKLPLSVAFTFGVEALGLPAMGLLGCALATLVVNWTLLALVLGLLRTQALYRPLQLWQRMDPPDWPRLRQFARLAVPGGLSVLVEVTSFTLMALFIARLGTAAAAAHQIASNLTALAYMVPLSLGLATSARMSFWLGQGQPARARQVAGLGLRVAMACALALAAVMLLFAKPLAGLYTTNPQVIAQAALLLPATAAYHLADAAQTLCIFMLRCYRVTVLPLLIYCTLLWGVGLLGGYRLAYQGLGPWAAMPSPLAFWIMGAAALALTALLFLGLLGRVLRARGDD